MRKQFRMMKEQVEIKKTHRPKRDVHDMPNETGRLTINDLHRQVEIISPVMERAIEVQSNLDTQFPSFVKPMIRSNVTAGFWLSLPKLFCDLHLPSHDIEITLVDESHEEYYTKYLPYRRGLSAGWRGFSIAHNLEEGDILVFHLVGVCKMKVYIVRANHFSTVDAALSLLHLQAHAKFVNYALLPSICMLKSRALKQESVKFPRIREKLLRSLSSGMSHNNFKEGVQSSKSRVVMNHTRNISEDLALALEGLVFETMSIAKAIKVCKFTASPQDYIFWNKRSTTIRRFQITISQISARLDQLVFVVLDSRNTSVNMSLEQDGLKQDFEDEMNVFKAKMQELQEVTQKLYAETEVLRITAEMHKLKFCKELK